MSWTLTKKLDAFASPGEIKRREVSWTLTKKLDAFAGPGEIKRREMVLDPQVSPGEIKRRKMVLDPQVGPEEIKSREVELGLNVGLLLRQLFPNSGATDIGFVILFRTAVGTVTTLVAAQWRSGHCLNIFVVLAAVHGVLGLPGWRLRLSLHTFVPLPPLSPSLINILLSVDVKQNNSQSYWRTL